MREAATVVSAGGILVIDRRGSIFGLLRSARIGVALWRATARALNFEGSGLSLAVAATYERSDWSVIADLVDHVPTVIIAAQYDDEEAGRAVTTGAFGYIAATLSTDALRRAIQGALNGEPAYSRRAVAHGLRSIARPRYSGKALTLTPRQRQVVTLIAQGAADKEIAAHLGITTATAQKHVTNLLRRLNVPNRAAAAALLVRSTAWSSAADSVPGADGVPATDQIAQDHVVDFKTLGPQPRELGSRQVQQVAS